MKDSSKIVIATWGTLGDLLPYIALAKGLQKLGYEPVIAAQAEYKDAVESQGVQFKAMRPSMADLKSQFKMDEASIWRKFYGPVMGPFFIIRKILMANLKSSYEDIYEISHDANLVITHSIAYGAMIAADKRNIPRISVALAPLVLMSVYDAPELWIMQMLHRLSPRARLKISEIFRSSLLKLFGQLFNPIYRLRSELDLPRPKDIFEAAYSSLGTICLWSPSFAAKQPDSPPNTHIVGFPFRSRSHETLPPPKLEEFLECGEKPLVFTLGSFGWAAGGNFYQESIKVARQLGMRAVLLTGKGNDLGDLLDASPDIITCDFVDHAYLFPRAAVVIHHGGPGTLSEALRAGCPQLIVPISSDQPDSARRAAAMGVAKVLPIKQYRGKKLFENLSYLQSNELIQARAKAISKLVLEERGISDAAAIIHSVIQSRQTADLEVPSPTEARALEASS